MACVSPVFAIVTAGTDPNADTVTYGQTAFGANLTGIVEITSSIGGCTGSLLSGGLAILTAGHCVTSAYGAPIATGITVYLQSASGMIPYTVSSVQVDPGYVGGDSTLGADLAVLQLSTPAPSFDIGYSLYTSSSIPSTPVVLAGYGYGGTGNTGADSSNYPFGTLRAGENIFEGTGAQYFGWSSSLLVGQFYNGQSSTNVLGVAHPYFSADEVSSSHGDSGGPALYNGYIIGVTDLGICASSSSTGDCSMPPSVNAANDAYFGEMFAYTSVDANLAFIQSAQGVPEPGTFAMAVAALGIVISRHRRNANKTLL